MPSDLRKPLLGRQKKGAGINRRFSVIMALSVLAVFSIGGLSVYTALSPGNLQKTASGPDAQPQLAEKTPETPAAKATAPADAAALQPQSGRSGANINRETMPDGNVVSVYSPRPREGDGPVLMSGQTYGQDPRMATRPNEELLEETAFGRLPVVGADGLLPMEQYARPWSGARGTRVAIVVGGLGLSQTGSQKAIRELPPEVTLGFAASGNSLQRWMQEARRQGHEILLQIPLEPFGYPGTNPGPDTLLAGDPAKVNIDRLHRSMAKITNYTGIMNYLGGRFLAEQAALEPVMRDIGKRGLLFLDDGSSAQSLSGGIAKAISAPQGFADILLDGEVTEAAILRKLDELERIARRNGQAIGVASAFDESVAAISKWSREAGGRGIEIVGVSALVSGQAGQ
ncbi:polysaccharide deacetylase [Agrobacterium sp. TS43]|uniref:divergent polysaccharide deacetylase family protein n=1 Tax=Agrobacterium TaxID=357 RepID=UPI000360FC0A|nr:MULTISPECIES: divergent polysaccharide deacetylase family protein [Agrobacterium]EPR18113.1 polysaccharide deacetylase [Agrobacterium radiobacter DSM 30147]KDR86243.1 polysaccharide deacetylase [Agrobacterium tumefaciens GW4]KVK42633.1 polysaccharide deacetylase [Agrobacterium sp. LY4]KVK42966.1 polysaccharide deacetylase [Agrobacterium sp. JL28]KVK57213.1 polysaccharide deacetylase [Agrobacterium sp. TS45]